MAKKKGIGVNSVILIIVVVLVVGLSLGVFYKAPVEKSVGEGELAQMAGGGGGDSRGFGKDWSNPTKAPDSLGDGMVVEEICSPSDSNWDGMNGGGELAQMAPGSGGGTCYDGGDGPKKREYKFSPKELKIIYSEVSGDLSVEEILDRFCAVSSKSSLLEYDPPINPQGCGDIPKTSDNPKGAGITLGCTGWSYKKKVIVQHQSIIERVKKGGRFQRAFYRYNFAKKGKFTVKTPEGKEKYNIPPDKPVYPASSEKDSNIPITLEMFLFKLSDEAKEKLKAVNPNLLKIVEAEAENTKLHEAVHIWIMNGHLGGEMTELDLPKYPKYQDLYNGKKYLDALNYRIEPPYKDYNSINNLLKAKEEEYKKEYNEAQKNEDSNHDEFHKREGDFNILDEKNGLAAIPGLKKSKCWFAKEHVSELTIGIKGDKSYGKVTGPYNIEVPGRKTSTTVWKGEEVELKALPKRAYKFKEWTTSPGKKCGCEEKTKQDCSFTVSVNEESYECIAEFKI